MAGLTRRVAMAALGLAGLLAAAAAPASAEWTEWDAADELGWVQGEADAPLTVIEYFSPTCSHCREFAEDVLPTIQENYIATGKVRLIMREWIRNSVDTILITQARCLSKEDGLAYLEDVFEKQEDVFAAAQIGTLSGTLTLLGAPYGITDADKVDACYKDMNTRFDIQEVDQSSAHYGVSATPTFIVGGEVHASTVAMLTPEGFSEFLDAELAKTGGATN